MPCPSLLPVTSWVKLPDGRCGVITPAELVVPRLPEREVLVRLASRGSLDGVDGLDGVRVGQEIWAEFRELEPFDAVDTPRLQRCMKLCEYLHKEMQIQTVIREAKEIQYRASGRGTSGAEFLHHHISADRWGITAASLRNFEATVRKKWRQGQMQNTGDYSPSSFQNGNIGPNIYQVNDQVIKPMTADPSLILPGVSWALSDCLAGHAVTHFVSHAWAEGLFEFCRLLFQQWLETEGTSAYICFLSNPQNLDIASFLATVETSPFYVALQNMPSSGQMIMVATSNSCLHSRLWCVFEAHMAIQRGIPILLSGSPANLGKSPFSVLVMRKAIATFNDCYHAKCNKGISGPEIDEENQEVARPEKCAGICCSFSGMWLLWLILGLLILWLLPNMAAKDWFAENTLVVIGASMLLLFYISFTLTLAFSSCKVCCVKCFELAAVSGQFVDVRKAQCRDEADALRIRNFIAGQEDLINSMLGRYFLTLSRSES